MKGDSVYKFNQFSAKPYQRWRLTKIYRCEKIMSNILTPMKVLLDMDITTKSTYRAVLDGLDLAMVDILSKLGYDPCDTKSTVELYRQPTDVRLEAAKKRLEAFATNKEVGLFDFVKYARNTIAEFLEVVNLGFLHELRMVDSGMFEIVISCMLHEGGIDNQASEKVKFENQLKYLTGIGLEIEKAKGLSSYWFIDTDNNRSVIRRILKDRGAQLIRIDSLRDEIDKVTFMLDPINLSKFTEEPIDYTLPKTDELNEDEMIKMKKLVSEIPSSLAFINESPDMLQTCGYLAESSFAEICEIVNHNGVIFKRVKERHAKERAANMNIREIEKEIGAQFPAEIARKTMEKVAATLAYFCVENMHSTTKNLTIDQWGILRVGVKWCSSSRELRYGYYFGEEYNKPCAPSEKALSEVFDIAHNQNGGLCLVDESANKKTFTNMLRYIDGFEIDSVEITRDNCWADSSIVGNADKSLRNIFVINSLVASTDNIEGILHQYDISGMKRVEAE